MIILQFGPNTNKNTYLHSISNTVRNREIIAANAYLLKYDYNDKQTTYKAIRKDDEKFSSVIKLLIASKDLVLNASMQDKTHYSVGIFTNIETSKGVEQIEIRINTQSYDVYFPKIDAYYIASDAYKENLKEVLD